MHAKILALVVANDLLLRKLNLVAIMDRSTQGASVVQLEYPRDDFCVVTLSEAAHRFLAALDHEH